MKKVISLMLPPFIGSLLLLGIVFYNEIRTDYSGIEPCEINTLTLPHYVILLVGFTIVGGLVQIGIASQIIKILKIESRSRWIALGGFLTTLIGLGITILMWTEENKDLIDSTLIGFPIAAVYVVGNLMTMNLLHKKMYGI
jgi:hypothetical protein